MSRGFALALLGDHRAPVNPRLIARERPTAESSKGPARLISTQPHNHCSTSAPVQRCRVDNPRQMFMKALAALGNLYMHPLATFRRLLLKARIQSDQGRRRSWFVSRRVEIRICPQSRTWRGMPQRLCIVIDRVPVPIRFQLESEPRRCAANTPTSHELFLQRREKSAAGPVVQYTSTCKHHNCHISLIHPVASWLPLDVCTPENPLVRALRGHRPRTCTLLPCTTAMLSTTSSGGH
jgi:hypothetical protein